MWESGERNGHEHALVDTLHVFLPQLQPTGHAVLLDWTSICFAEGSDNKKTAKPQN